MKLFRNQGSNQGFTLVEMLVIAPILILSIGVFIGVIINLTGEVLSSRGSNVLAYNLQDALNRIEEDVRLSSGYLAKNSIDSTVDNPQGYGANGSVAAFTNAGGTSGNSLILSSIATTANPLSLTSGFVYRANSPSNCSDPLEYSKNNAPMVINIVYFVYQNALWRRVIMPLDYANIGTWCGDIVWQQPSCQPEYTHSFCKTNDEKLLDGVAAESFYIQYYPNATNNTQIAAASNPAAIESVRANALLSATTVNVSIGATQNIAGRDIERSGTIRVTRLDTNASAIAVQSNPSTPASPSTVTANVTNGNQVTYSWPNVSGATAYSFEYRINGGSWVTGDLNLSNSIRTYTVTNATHTNTVEARVAAKNSAGNSAYTYRAITVPLWATLPMQNSWNDFNGEYAPASFTKTSAGVVMVRGGVKKGGAASVGEVVGKLPVGYRPGQALAFGGVGLGEISSRVDVLANGDIVAMEDFSTTWQSLDSISFVPDGLYTRTNVLPESAWSNWGAGFRSASRYQDSVGRVHLEGVLSVGYNYDTTVILTLPFSLRPDKTLIVPSRSGSFSHMGITQTPTLESKGDGWSPYSINATYYPVSTATWTTLSLQNSWVSYDGGTTHALPRFTKASDNIVTLSGMMQAGDASNGTTVATLPAGSRPTHRMSYMIANSSLPSRVDVFPNGDIQLIGSHENAWLSLDGISFYGQ